MSLKTDSTYVCRPTSTASVESGAMTSKSFNVRHFESSIHTPAKGATIGFCLSGIPFIVSIHAPAKGATPIYVIICFRIKKRLVNANLLIILRAISNSYAMLFGCLTISKSWPVCEPCGRSRHAWGSQKRFQITCQMIRGPLRSAAGLAPTCSTFRAQFEPR